MPWWLGWGCTGLQPQDHFIIIIFLISSPAQCQLKLVKPENRRLTDQRAPNGDGRKHYGKKSPGKWDWGARQELTKEPAHQRGKCHSGNGILPELTPPKKERAQPPLLTLSGVP